MPRTSDTRERIVEAALDLFHAQGVTATGLGQILETAGAGKGQFYHYFESKEALLLAVLEEFQRRLHAGEVPVMHELKSFKDLERWFGFFLEAQREMGWARSCPVGTIAAEIGDDQPELREKASEIFCDARAVLVEFFTRMRAEGRLKRSADPESLADFCHAITQGGLLVAKIERRGEPFERAVRHALAHVKSLRA